ncbi:MAG: hypothetical protein JOY90_34810 [Bradyrhizobium sp.]|uniref:hypothetical protein n=1 Tax=Bradyrhizobium sp. TaxID=376 RepID=UPI001DA4C72A|nr:hypothetical protein [Bradyrhizobium sp.]MBV9565585.1 hypothetical protein [Bradyrhizobium sp.]
MPRLGPKALFAIFTLGGSRRQRPNWNRIILMASVAVTIGLIAIYLYGKDSLRW